MGLDLETGAAQHGFHCAAVGDPPVGLIAGVFVLDEVHAREVGLPENVLVPELVVLLQLRGGQGAAHHGLKNQLSTDLGDDLVESEKGVTQVVKHPHKQHVIKLSGKLIHVINRALSELDVQVQDFGSKAPLAEVTIINVQSYNPAGATSFKLQTVETGVAPDVEHGGSGEIPGYFGGNLLPFHAGEIAQKVMRGGGDTEKVEVMEPFAELLNTTFQFVSVEAGIGRFEGKNFGLNYGHLLEFQTWQCSAEAELLG